MSEIKKLDDSKIVRLVGSDAEYIKNEIDQANKAFGKSLEHYRNAGERLAAVRDDMKAQGSRKGKGFSAWIEQNCGLTKTHAYRYISLFENWDNLVTLMLLSPEVFSLTDALKAIKDINAATLEAQDDAIDTIATEVQEKLEHDKKELEKQKRALEKSQETLNRKNLELYNKADELNKKELELSKKEVELVKTAKQKAEELVKKAQKAQLEAEQKAKEIIQEANEKALKVTSNQAKSIVEKAKNQAQEIINQAEKKLLQAESDRKQAQEKFESLSQQLDDPKDLSKRMVAKALKEQTAAFQNLLNNKSVYPEHQQFIKSILDLANDFLANG